jgi:hypothetical protein
MDLTREVSATPSEYARGLRLAFPVGLSGGPLEFQVSDGGVKMEIALVVGPERRIALLRLPTLMVQIRFVSGDPVACERVLKHMDLAMRRGGG